MAVEFPWYDEWRGRRPSAPPTFLHDHSYHSINLHYDTWSGITFQFGVFINITMANVQEAFNYVRGAVNGGHCEKLVHVEMCEGLERIETRSFQSCTSLKQISIPTTVEVISNYAFYGCTRIRDIEFREGSFARG